MVRKATTTLIGWTRILAAHYSIGTSFQISTTTSRRWGSWSSSSGNRRRLFALGNRPQHGIQSTPGGTTAAGTSVSASNSTTTIRRAIHPFLLHNSIEEHKSNQLNCMCRLSKKRKSKQRSNGLAMNTSSRAMPSPTVLLGLPQTDLRQNPAISSRAIKPRQPTHTHTANTVCYLSIANETMLLHHRTCSESSPPYRVRFVPQLHVK
jgi:hypothetical protein